MLRLARLLYVADQSRRADLLRKPEEDSDMSDWEIPKSQAKLQEEIDYYEGKAQEMRKYRDPHCKRMERMYLDLASHRRRLLSGLSSRDPVAA